MFRTLAQLYTDPIVPAPTPPAQRPPGAESVFATAPIQLSRWLEEVWAKRGVASWPGFKTDVVGSLDTIARLGLPAGLLGDGLRSGITDATLAPPLPAFSPPGTVPFLGADRTLPWDHLIYAYLIESTGIVPILAEVVRRFVVGETLDAPTPPTIAWARSTEELFFRDPPLFHLAGVTSQLRPDGEVNRRNAYWRMFGWDLPHGRPGGGNGPDPQPWKRDAGSTANLRFLELWNELLRQVWLGIENEKNAVGANPTDSTYIAYLCQTIGEMLRMRRRSGMLAREEFAYVTMLSWFHMSVESDTSVVTDLRATAGGAGNPADRLSGIAARVGISMSGHARELFELADLMSPVLWFIEFDAFSDVSSAELLWRQTGSPFPQVARDMARIVDLWQSATGNRVKDLAITARSPGQPAPRAVQPTRLPAGPALATPVVPPRVSNASSNGHAPVRV